MILRALLVLAVFLSTAQAGAVAFNEAQKSDLQRISSYLNDIRTVKGHFVQIGPDGTSDEGTFYLKKPGRLRFEYTKPNRTLVVSDGTTFAVENTALKTTDRYPLSGSPLGLILGDHVDLVGDPRVTGVKHETGALTMTARQDSGPAPYQVAVTFADAGGSLELRQWEITDAQGLRTMVALSGLAEGGDLPPSLFVIQDLSPFQNHR